MADLTNDFAMTLDSGVPGVTSLIESQQQSGESWTDALTRLLPQLVATYQQKQFLTLNMRRAEQGLPPLNASDYGLGVKVGLTDDVKSLLLWGLLGVGAVIYLTSRR
jgi:hypothetical protein